MTQPEAEPWSPRPLANTLPTKPMCTDGSMADLLRAMDKWDERRERVREIHASVVLSSADSCRNIHIYTDAMNNRHMQTSLTIMYLSFRGERFENVYSRFACGRVLEIEHNCNILTPKLMAVTLCLSYSPEAQPEVRKPTLLGNGFLYCILSATSLVPKLHRGSRWPPSARCGFPYHISSFSNWNSNWHLTSVLTQLYNSSTPTRSPT